MQEVPSWIVEEDCPLFLSTSAAGVSHKQLLLLECLLMGLKTAPAPQFFNIEPVFIPFLLNQPVRLLAGLL